MFVLAMVAKVEVLMLLLLLLEPSIQIGRSNHCCIVLGPRHCRRHSRRTFVRLWVVQCFFRAAANDGKRLGGGGALMWWWVDVVGSCVVLIFVFFLFGQLLAAATISNI